MLLLDMQRNILQSNCWFAVIQFIVICLDLLSPINSPHPAPPTKPDDVKEMTKVFFWNFLFHEGMLIDFT